MGAEDGAATETAAASIDERLGGEADESKGRATGGVVGARFLVRSGSDLFGIGPISRALWLKRAEEGWSRRLTSQLDATVPNEAAQTPHTHDVGRKWTSERGHDLDVCQKTRADHASSRSRQPHHPCARRCSLQPFL